MSQKLVRALTSDEKENRGWKVIVDGEEVDASEAELRNEKMGLSIRYGMRAEGYDGAVISMPSGGGSVIVPWTIWEDELYIGVLLQERKLQGGQVHNLPRGFVDPNETHLEAANREAQEELEEAGIDVSKILQVESLLDAGVNPDSAFFDTSNQGEGVHFFSMRVDPQLLEMFINIGLDEPLSIVLSPHLLFKKDLVRPVTSQVEKITGCYFVPWKVLTRRANEIWREKALDGFTLIGISLLLAKLLPEKPELR